MTVAPALLALIAAAACLQCSTAAPAGASAPPVPRSFGNGLISTVSNASEPLVVLEHTLGDDAAYGVMTHYWSTCVFGLRLLFSLFNDQKSWFSHNKKLL